MTICSACGGELGLNSKCEDCLGYLLEEGGKQMDEESARDSVRQAERWLRRAPKLAPDGLVKQLQLLLRIIKEYFTGEYRAVPYATIAALAVALVYVITPFDLIPDFIPVIGFLDDLAMLRLVFSAVGRDLRQYCAERGLEPEEYGL